MVMIVMNVMIQQQHTQLYKSKHDYVLVCVLLL